MKERLMAAYQSVLRKEIPAVTDTVSMLKELPGTWEGTPLPMFAGIICDINVENVLIYGEGTINGNASKQNWWYKPKVMNIAFRPRLFFINRCNNVTVQGVKFCNSPSWTIHPYFSDDLKFINLIVENPAASPNTDGVDPESCKNVDIIGVRFSLGDDCIAVKSGKIYMGRKFKRPSENTMIRRISYAENPKKDVPAMSGGVEASTKRGMFARNVAKLTLDNVTINGQDGEVYEFIGVDEIIRK